jgi:hypothetical protein
MYKKIEIYYICDICSNIILFTCTVLQVWNLVSDIKGRTQTEVIWAQGADGNISTEGGLKFRSPEKIA